MELWDLSPYFPTNKNWVTLVVCSFETIHQKLNGTESQRTPFSTRKLRSTLRYDRYSGFFLNGVRGSRGSCGSDFLKNQGWELSEFYEVPFGLSRAKVEGCQGLVSGCWPFIGDPSDFFGTGGMSPPGGSPGCCVFCCCFILGMKKNWLFRVSGLYHPGYMRIISS